MLVIEYQVVHSRRKTLALQVKRGQVFVRAPYHLDEQQIHAFIHKKEAWLNAKIFEQLQTAEQCCQFNQGATLLVFGQQVKLNIIYLNARKQPDVYLSSDTQQQQTLTIAFNQSQQTKWTTKLQQSLAVKKKIEAYFKAQAQDIIFPKVDYYARLTQLSPTNIKIRQYRARWGSCNSKGELSFNYLLMMLPVFVIDYVVIHELCHLRHLNHSSDFWRLVAIYCPNFKEAKAWIKANQGALQWRQPQA